MDHQSSKQYVYVGTWEIPSLEPDIHGVYRYELDPDTLELHNKLQIVSDVNVGVIRSNQSRDTLFVTDERRGHPLDCTGGGGRIFTLTLDPQTGLILTSHEALSYGVYPCYLTLLPGEEDLLLCNLGSSSPVTKLVRSGESYQVQCVYDDSTIVWYHLKEGRPAQVCDAYIGSNTTSAPDAWQSSSHIHSVLYDPRRNVVLACDRGSNEILVFFPDIKARKLRLLHRIKTPAGTGPRYLSLPAKGEYVFVSNELLPTIDAYRYTAENSLELACSLSLLSAPHSGAISPFGIHPSDLQLHPTGKYLYAAMRGTNTISVIGFEEDAVQLSLLETVSCMGENPRGMSITADGKALLCVNSDSSGIVTFWIREDGRLEFSGNQTAQKDAAAIYIL